MPYPAKKTPELCARVIERLSLGETLSSISRELKFSAMAWSNWCRSDKDLGIAHDEARTAGADAIADDVLAIVDEKPTIVDDKIDPGHVSWAKNRAEYRLKLLAKWQPMRYGDAAAKDKVKDEEIDAPDADALAAFFAETILAAKRNSK